MRVPSVGLAAIVALTGLGMGIRIAVWPLAPVSLPSEVGRSSNAERARSPEGADTITAYAIARDPFRIARRPATTPFALARVGQPEAPAVPKPALILVGIVWEGGANPTALIIGLPGIDGTRVVRPGDVVGGLRVRAILSASVRVTGLDTAWTLRMREPGS